METLKKIKEQVSSYCSQDGSFNTPIEGLNLYRASRPQTNAACVIKPAIGLVVQGAKRVYLGNKHWTYKASDYLLISAELPLHSSVIEAGYQAPYLGLSLELDLACVTEVATEVGIDFGTLDCHPSPLTVRGLENEMKEAIVRYVGLLKRPSEAPFLAPLIRKEIIFYLLRSGQAPSLKRITMATPGSSILEALRWLRLNFREQLRIEELAESLSISPSSLHHQFKALTSTSPLQYQKLLRLQEARNLLITESDTAAGISEEVGYNSPSQFSREYKRLFGVSPSEEAARWRNQAV